MKWCSTHARIVFWSLLIAAGVGLLVFLYAERANAPAPVEHELSAPPTPVGTPPTAVSPAAPITATFTCPSGASVTATFHSGDDSHVTLTLSDGRTLSVPQALSASGARYATPDESFVFWNKGDSAFITEGGTTTVYTDCVTAPLPL